MALSTKILKGTLDKNEAVEAWMAGILANPVRYTEDRKIGMKQVKAGDLKTLHRLADDAGLLLIWNQADGTQPAWRFEFKKPSGAPGFLSAGTYPDTSLEAARKKVGGWIVMLRQGQDPAEALAAERAAKKAEAAAKAAEKATKAIVKRGDVVPLSFKAVSKAMIADWRARKANTAGHINSVEGYCVDYLWPAFGDVRMDLCTEEVMSPAILAVRDGGTKTGAPGAYTAKYLVSLCASIFRWGKATAEFKAVCKHNHGADMTGIAKHKSVEHPQLKDMRQIGDLIKAAYASAESSPRSDYALIAQMMLWQRPITICEMEWEELHAYAPEDPALIEAYGEVGYEWRVPAWKTGVKNKEEDKDALRARKAYHAVPLPRQLVDIIIGKMEPLTKGKSKYVFGTAGRAGQLGTTPLDLSTLGDALKRACVAAGIPEGAIDLHGFRGTCKTMILELHAKNPVAVGDMDGILETNLCHKYKGAQSSTYTSPTYVDPRLKALQMWADTLDLARAGHFHEKKARLEAKLAARKLTLVQPVRQAA